MAMDYFSISTDTSFMGGRSTASQMFIPTPENEREVPCDTCERADTCAAQGIECVAARQWYGSGNYQDSDVGRLIRAYKR
jgi:hypothetical protein